MTVAESSRDVVGVPGYTKSVYLKSAPRPAIYLSASQAPWYADGMNSLVRGTVRAPFASLARWAIAEIDPRQTADRFQGAVSVATRMAESWRVSRS